MLHVLVTHLEERLVRAELDYLRALAPDARFAVAYGGPRETFERLTDLDAVWVDDPTLRAAPMTIQSYHVLLGAVWRQWIDPDPAVDAVYVFEYDHLVLRGDFEATLRELLDRSGADLLGKGANERSHSSWKHYARWRKDPLLRAFLERVTVRDDPTRMFGMLGNGFVLRREALAAYAAVEEHPTCYGELYIPTLLHHLGFRIADVDALSDVYGHVRFLPLLDLDEVLALKARGASFAHPFKDLAGGLERIAAAPGARG